MKPFLSCPNFPRRNAFAVLAIASFLLVRECPAPIQVPDEVIDTHKKTPPTKAVPTKTAPKEKPGLNRSAAARIRDIDRKLCFANGRQPHRFR